jgi:CcmD family protein
MRYSVALVLSIFAQVVSANETIEMADKMRSEGKIYVVVAVLSVILLGLFFYLFSIDRKVSKLEKNSSL